MRNKIARGYGLPGRSTVGSLARKHATYALLFGGLSGVAHGQAQSQPEASDNAPEEVLVTGSRIQRTGMTTPTPVTAVTADELRRFVSQKLAAFKVPVEIVIQHDPLPRNANGKIMKSELRPLFTPRG